MNDWKNTSINPTQGTFLLIFFCPSNGFICYPWWVLFPCLLIKFAKLCEIVVPDRVGKRRFLSLCL
jgi:hypothetical protein